MLALQSQRILSKIDAAASLRDPMIDLTEVQNSLKKPSEQPTMLGTTKEIAYSLVEMNIPSEDLPMVGANKVIGTMITITSAFFNAFLHSFLLN